MARVEAASGAGAASAARKVLREANAMCPVDTGAMRDSGGYEITGPGEAAVGYLRPGKDGALITRRMHEDLSLNHPVGQAKWLQAAIEQYAGRAAADFAGVIKPALR